MSIVKSSIASLIVGTSLSVAHSSEDRAVRIFLATSQYEPAVFTGQTVPANRLITILFVKEKCPLPIESANKMFRAWRSAGAYQLGCWYPTVNDEYVW